MLILGIAIGELEGEPPLLLFDAPVDIMRIVGEVALSTVNEF